MRLRTQLGTFHSASVGLRHVKRSRRTAMLWHAVASCCTCNFIMYMAHHSFFTTMLWHVAEYGCTSNLARFIVPMLACVMQAHSFHINAVACCRLRLHMHTSHISWCLCWLALGKRSLLTAVLWACCCTCNKAHFRVPMLARLRQAQPFHCHAVTCCRMLLLMRPGTFTGPMLACVRQAHLIHSKCCGRLSHAVEHATWHISLCLGWVAFGKLRDVVACCRMQLHMQPGTFHCAYDGLRLASAAYSQQCCCILLHMQLPHALL